jgi:hypothetical protein
MAPALIVVWLVCTYFASLSQAFSAQRITVAQLDCSLAKRLYDQAHEATCMHEYERALPLLEQVKSAVPRQCRLESDEVLEMYKANIRGLIAERQAGGPPTPCRPVRTGPTSYSCGVAPKLSEEERRRCRGE